MYNDDFDDLIKKFNLDDQGDSPPERQNIPQRQESPRRPSPNRTSRPRQDTPSSKGQRPAGTNSPRKQQATLRNITRLANGSLIVAGLVAFSIFLAVFILQSATDLFGLNKPENTVEVEIPEDSSLSQIARILHEAGVINQPLTFRLYTAVKGEADTLTGGTYEMETDWDYNQIISALQPSELETATVSVTFIEGMTAEEIGELLEENNVCTKEAFLEAVDNTDFGFSFEEEIPDDPLRLHKLEGYLFPDTYQFYVGEQATSVVTRFLTRFNEVITDDMRQQMDAMGMTLDETITLASIIQREAGYPDIMADVSAVFHNRLESTSLPRLESDVTTNYIADYIGDNEEMAAAYDTFSRSGLPVGPVSNPGLDAIEAALNPSDHSYYFFVSDNAGEYYFASTLAEHDANVYRVSQINAQLAASQDEEE